MEAAPGASMARTSSGLRVTGPSSTTAAWPRATSLKQFMALVTAEAAALEETVAPAMASMLAPTSGASLMPMNCWVKLIPSSLPSTSFWP